MADKTVFNGIDPALDSSVNGIPKKDRDLEIDSEVSDLKRKIIALEEEKYGFIGENEAQSDRIKILMLQVEGLKQDRAEMEGRLEQVQREMDQSEEDKKAMKAVAARAAELETELFRSQHDFISLMSERDEVSEELRRLNEAFEELVKVNREKDSKMAILEKERAEPREKMEKETSEMGSRIRKLEDDAKGKVSELRKLEKEKGEIEAAKSALEGKLRRSDEKSEDLEKLLKELKSKNSEMEENLVGCQAQKSVLEDRVAELARKLEKEEGDNELVEKEKSLKFAWPATTTVAAAAAASTGTVAAAAAMFYLKYARQR